LVSGACFADFGHQVTCVDKDASKIAALQRGKIPIFEPDLDRLVQNNVKNGRLDFATDLAGPVREADAVFIAVGTPSRRGDGHADLSYVYAASREIAAAVDGFTVVITKSTVPVGTGDEVERLIRETNPSADVAVASNPEFLREGAAIRDFKFPDRIVVGTHDERARTVISEIYRPLYLIRPCHIHESPYCGTHQIRGECISATKITFINEIADLAERSARMCRRSPAALDSTTASARNFFMPGQALVGRAFRKTPAR
jgi:UDPglucose 6-dehydrogenase